MNRCQNGQVERKIESVHLKWVGGSRTEYLYLVNAC